MKYAKSLFILGYSLNIVASEIPWVESTYASSVIACMEVVSQCSKCTDISFVRPVTLASLQECLSGARSNSSPTPIVAEMLSKVDPFDKELNIGEWISTCSLDELDK